ncbi:fizzy-related protein homolog, partial [Zootermopsis nevadensis]|uniref:fizzy-related protein homolog n=1 Tax=Zootermopsis nevadensis TaxID=136037 RepID=UPI000B8EBAF7
FSWQQTDDRFIRPRYGKRWQMKFEMKTESGQNGFTTKEACENGDGGSGRLAYTCLLINELLGANIQDLRDQCDERRALIPGSNIFSLSPLSAQSQKLLSAPRRSRRKISPIPYKTLDASYLQDDLSLNLVDWSSENVLSVGLGTCVYIFCASTNQVGMLCNLSGDGTSVTSVAWNEHVSIGQTIFTQVVEKYFCENFLVIGTYHGYVQVWDVAVNSQVNELLTHPDRVGLLAWNGGDVSSGSRDGLILQLLLLQNSVIVFLHCDSMWTDIYTSVLEIDEVSIFSSEDKDISSPHRITTQKNSINIFITVCGLKWSPDKRSLASGGNDNRLNIWDLHSDSPVQTYTEHLAAVKAISWSPQHRGLLASGGGAADWCIRFWNTLTGQPKQWVDTGSEVCNLVWSKHSSELVSSLHVDVICNLCLERYQINSWEMKYTIPPTVVQSTQLLLLIPYLAMSPDGEDIVTGAGDETLRFWKVFSKDRSQKEKKP